MYPFGLVPLPRPSVPPTPITHITNTSPSLFSNNSLVFYKPSSLASGGVNTVTNSRHKARRT